MPHFRISTIDWHYLFHLPPTWAFLCGFSTRIDGRDEEIVCQRHRWDTWIVDTNRGLPGIARKLGFQTKRFCLMSKKCCFGTPYIDSLCNRKKEKKSKQNLVKLNSETHYIHPLFWGNGGFALVSFLVLYFELNNMHLLLLKNFSNQMAWITLFHLNIRMETYTS